jgi:hypothetical protein
MTHTRTRAGGIRRLAATAVLAAAATACGGDQDYANAPRPPAPITVTAAITDQRVDVSPRSFGAGPIVLVIANQTARSQEVMLETDEVASGRPGIRQRTSPVNPRGTAELKVDIGEGTYRLSAGSDDVRPATLRVGARRTSAQNELLQP